MTTEEKRQRLEQFCEEQDGCGTCILHEITKSCDFCNAEEVPDPTIDILYGAAFPTAEAPHIKDSGTRRKFDTGAVRDIQEGKGRCDLMPLEVVGCVLNDWKIDNIYLFQATGDRDHLIHILEKDTVMFPDPKTMFLEVAKHFEDGAKKYGENNWQKGIPVRCYIDSAIRHYLKWLRGDKDEPHDRAFCWNILCAIWTCEHMPELNDYGRTVCPCCGTVIPDGEDVCPHCLVTLKGGEGDG